MDVDLIFKIAAIGILVAELKEKIEKQIVVKKDRSGGSHAAIQA